MRPLRRRVCSSGLTSSQYLIEDDPGLDHGPLDGRCLLEEPLGLLGRAEAHDPLDAGAVVPAAIEDDDLAGSREVLDVALDVHLRLLALRRRRQGHDLEDARADPLGDALDGAALAGGVTALEHDADLGAGRFDPFLHGHELAVKAAHLALVLLAASFAWASPEAAVDGASRTS